MIRFDDGRLTALQSCYLDMQLDRAQRLAADLARLREGHFPGPAELSDAPTISHWRRAQRAVPCLHGSITGHPQFGTTLNGLTTDLWAIDLTSGWARTLSRWYRLGPELPNATHDAGRS